MLFWWFVDNVVPLLPLLKNQVKTIFYERKTIKYICPIAHHDAGGMG
jgi:hypothetical protein